MYVELQEQEQAHGAQRGMESGVGLGSEEAGDREVDADGAGAGMSVGTSTKFGDVPSPAEGMAQGAQ